MQMYSVINTEYLKPFEPSLLDDDEDPLTADCILEKKATKTRCGQIESYRIGRKGQLPSKSKWFHKEQGIQEFPHFQF